MTESDLLHWLLNQNAFKEEYEKLLLASVSSQFSALSREYTHDWNYLLKCAGFLAYSKDAKMQDIALRITQFCLQSKHATTDRQKNSAQFILNVLANRRAIKLANDKGLLEEAGERGWQNSFIGNINWIKQEIEHSVWLRNGERMNVNVFQKSFWDALNKFQSLSISAPTSAGKSHLMKQWILEKISENKQILIIYVVPTRALIAEVEADFQRALSEEIQASKVNVTSFPFIQFSDDKKPCVYVLTQERLQLLLQHISRKIDILIVDEAYKLADSDRGILLQHVIEKTILKNPSVKIIYISPLASNPEILVDNSPTSYSQKFEDIMVNQNLIWATQKRGAKWALELFHAEGKSTIGDITLSSSPSSSSLRLPMLAYALGQSGGSIIYVNGAADAEKAAQQLCDMIGFDNQINDKKLFDLIELCQKAIHKEYRLIETLKYGVAFHYGNIPLLIRDEIESLFKEGVIQFLVCTSTLVEGVNLPCRNIFIRSPQRGSGNPMNSADFWNLAGRAGRWGKDFQGNIICVDPILWNAPKTKTLMPLQRATEEVLGRQNDLIKFIENGTPRDSAASKENKILESMASYLTISYRAYGSIQNIPWMQKIDAKAVSELERAVSQNLLNSGIPEEIIANHPGISPLAMQEMLAYFENYEQSGKGKSLEDLLIPFATDTDAVGGYMAVFKRLFGRLTDEFGNNDGYIFREAIVTVHWMQGRPIKRIIEERKKVSPKESIHATIRNVLKDIESIARYKAPKYLSCYNDLLKHFFLKIGNKTLADEIEDVTLFLEMGVNTTTHLSLMNLGLSRTSTVEIKEYITADGFSERECLDWFTNPKNNWRSRDLPEIVKREIDKMLKMHTRMRA